MTTANRLILCGKNIIADAVLTATASPVSSQPLRHLQIPDRAWTWKQNSTSVVSIKGTWNGAGQYANFMHFKGHNLSNAATVRLQLHTNSDWTGATVYDSGTVDAYDADTLGELDWGVDALGSSIFDSYLGQRFTDLQFQEITSSFASFTLTITDTGNTDGFLQGQYLFMGKAIELDHNPAQLRFRWADNGVHQRQYGGGLRADGDTRWREIEADIAWVTPAQRALLADIVRNNGTNTGVYMNCFPAETGELLRDFTLIGKLKPPLPDFADRAYNQWTAKLSLSEE